MPTQARLLCDDYELTEYRALLERFYGFYAALALESPVGAKADEWKSRVAERAKLLELDLLDLGLSPAEIALCPRCRHLPAIDTSDRVLGCAYVLEGSTLGGRVIFKHLSRVFASREALPLRFFAGDGSGTAERWRHFCTSLDADAVDADEVCAAACAVFDALAAWLAEPSGIVR